MKANLPGHQAPGCPCRAAKEAVAAGGCLIMLLGPSGSGKSHLAREIAAAGQVLSLDRLRAIVSGDECDQDGTGDAVAALHLLTEARLRRGLSTVIDATNVEALARQPLLAIACRYQVPAIAVVMATPLENCLTRNASRPGPGPGARWGRRVPEPVVRAQHRQLLETLPSLADEGFARVLTCGPEGVT